jgi:hypothetical protein
MINEAKVSEIGISRRNRSTPRKATPVSLCPPESNSNVGLQTDRLLGDNFTTTKTVK